MIVTPFIFWILWLYVMIFVALYTWYIYKENEDKLPKSYSDSWYIISNKMMFNTFIMSIGIVAFILCQTWLMLIACVFLLLVQAAPAFKNEEATPDYVDKQEEQVHMVGAIGSIIIAFVDRIVHSDSIFVDKISPLIMGCYIVYAFGKKLPAYTLKIELLAFILLYINIAIG
jgi:hypothetical protein